MWFIWLILSSPSCFLSKSKQRVAPPITSVLVSHCIYLFVCLEIKQSCEGEFYKDLYKDHVTPACQSILWLDSRLLHFSGSLCSKKLIWKSTLGEVIQGTDASPRWMTATPHWDETKHVRGQLKHPFRQETYALKHFSQETLNRGLNSHFFLFVSIFEEHCRFTSHLLRLFESTAEFPHWERSFQSQRQFLRVFSETTVFSW